MELDVLAIIAAMGWSAVAFLKHLRSKAYHDAATLLVVVGVCILATWLVQASGRAFADSNAADLVLIGYAASSVLRVGYEFKKSFDNADSAQEAKLFSAPGSPNA